MKFPQITKITIRRLVLISTFTTLVPGDVIVTGTPTGAGARFDPPRYLKPGDVIEVEDLGSRNGTMVDGAYVTDVHGKRYLDGLAGLAGFPSGSSYNAFVPGLLVMTALFGSTLAMPLLVMRVRALASRRRSTRDPRPLVPSFTHTGDVRVPVATVSIDC